MSSWPPFFVALASSARRMSPAHVPQVGFRDFLHDELITAQYTYTYTPSHQFIFIYKTDCGLT